MVNVTVHRLPEMGLEGVTVTKTGSGAIVVSAKTERKNGISVQNTNQLAGNRTFIILLTLISFQGKCPSLPSRRLAVSQLSCPPSRSFRTVPSLRLTQAKNLQQSPCHDSDTSKLPACLPACLPQQITAAMSELALGVQRSRR